MIRWLFTCEHGGNRVPARWRHLFRGQHSVLDSHRGWDGGALCVFRSLAPKFADAAFHSRVTRLLVDLNRSEHHPGIFSEFTRVLSQTERDEILSTHYRPWRTSVVNEIDRWRSQGHSVIHISVHSFAPDWHGSLRNADIGLLYDPARDAERTLCRRWQARFGHSAPGLRVRLNYPYRGTADGFTTWLRRRHATGYAGIELELNQARVGEKCSSVATMVRDSLAPLVDEPVVFEEQAH